MKTDIRGRLMTCSYCKVKKVVMVGNKLYLGRILRSSSRCNRSDKMV